MRSLSLGPTASGALDDLLKSQDRLNFPCHCPFVLPDSKREGLRPPRRLQVPGVARLALLSRQSTEV